MIVSPKRIKLLADVEAAFGKNIVVLVGNEGTILLKDCYNGEYFWFAEFELPEGHCYADVPVEQARFVK